MPGSSFLRGLLVLLAAAGVCAAGATALPQKKPAEDETLPRPRVASPESAPSILTGPVYPIDLGSALRLADADNPEILRARQFVLETIAVRQLAALQLLPTLNVGTNFNLHRGVLQQADGNILKVNRESLYLGLGSGAVGAGTVSVPGLVLAGNVSQILHANLVARQRVRQADLGSFAVRNQVLLRVAGAYLDLLRAAGRRAVAARTRDEAAEVARVTAAFARTGQGRRSDADRAAAELEQRNAEVVQSEGDALTASARLIELLGLDPAVRLEPADGWVVPAPLVPEPIPLAELIALALTGRPELAERQAAVLAAFYRLREARLLPFSPTFLVGYSAGTFGGGSNRAAAGIPQDDGSLLVQDRFGNFAGRQDLDVVVYWSLRNLGLGNHALVRLAESNLRSTDLTLLETLNRVGAEVASAHARTHARFAEIAVAERALTSGQKAFREDLTRIKGGEGLPIEVLDSLRLLGRGRNAYLDAIIEYNRAHFELYVALGQPPADRLARPIGVDGGGPSPPRPLASELVPPPAPPRPKEATPR